jgi:hypothetical protein
VLRLPIWWQTTWNINRQVGGRIAFRVLSEALGEGRLARMFFVERESIKRK